MRIGYARVSTLDQNPDLQLERLKAGGCERVIVERASGARDDRPELGRLLRDVLRKGDTLVIWKLDRLARSLKQLIDTAEDLRGRGIGLVSLTDAIDTGSPGGMLVFHMLGAIAEFERALIRERTSAGLIEARRKGRVGGRPKLMGPKDVAAARALLADGSLTSREVAARFDVSKATLYRHLGAEPAQRT
ncbi:recombinase family protein [Methylobacterium sp. E-041]|uniref:recombinase family protein n=1 Tax=Methylobacterium sp. E-041 TaxID=2836573 RepID=UPI001FBA2A62|nr:recombinase family protein [Methylobacterium sp. E-041]MCJ2103824.1 recombinase family protein [Methylobacterium sp. E-041]